MKLKFLIALLILNAILLNSSAQSPMAISFGNTQDYILGQKGLVDHAGNTILASKIYINNANVNGDCPHLALFNSNFVMQWAFYLEEASYTTGQVIQSNGSDIIACWSTGVSSIILKCDINGNILWYKHYSNIHSIEGLACAEDGSIYANGNNLSDMVVLKLDASGNLLWSKKYNAGTHYFFGRGIEIAKDGNVVLMGGASFNTSSNSNKMTLIKITPGGQTIWSKVYECASTSILTTNFAQSPINGSFLLAGYSGHPSNTTVMNCLSVLVDSAGNYINNTELSFQYWDQYYAVAALPSGEFALSGLCKPQLTCGGNVIFVKVSANNDTVLTKTYGEVSGMGALFTDLKYSNTAGICAFGGGSRFKYWNNGSEIQCLRMDNNLNVGCNNYSQAYNKNNLSISEVGGISESTFSPSASTTYVKINHQIQAADACNQSPLSEKDIVNNLAEQVHIYPNPANDFLNIKAEQLKMQGVRIIDVQGKILMNQDKINNSQYSFSIQNLASGIYLIEIITSDHQKIHSTFKKW